jgi:hypothetical protein
MQARESWVFTAKWPSETHLYGPELVVSVYQPYQPNGEGLEVAVELRFDDAGPYVVGLAARTLAVMGDPAARRTVSPRDVQRLPLARIVNAVLAFAATVEKPTEENDEIREGVGPTWTEIYPDATVRTYYGVGAHDVLWEERGFQVPEEMVNAAQVVEPEQLPQPGKPNRGFYKWIAEEHRRHSRDGRSPAKEIAKEKGVPENRVHQWIHRARELGDLEASPRSRGRSSTA